MALQKSYAQSAHPDIEWIPYVHEVGVRSVTYREATPATKSVYSDIFVCLVVSTVVKPNMYMYVRNIGA